MNSCAHSVRPIHLNFATCQPAKVSKYFRWMSDVINDQFNDICNWVIKTFSLSDSAPAISSRVLGYVPLPTPYQYYAVQYYLYRKILEILAYFSINVIFLIDVIALSL